MENRHGLLVDFRLDTADGLAERRNALAMLDAQATGFRRVTLGADRAYDTFDFARQCRDRNVTPHVAQYTGRSSSIDRRTTRSPGYAVSQRIRKRVEEVFGWMKTVGNFRKSRYRGLAKSRTAALMVAAAYNLLRIAKLRLNGLAKHTAIA